MAAGGSAACSGWGSWRLIISARTVLTDQLLRAGIEDRGARLFGKCLKIGEGLPATLAAIAAEGLLKRLQIRQAAGPRVETSSFLIPQRAAGPSPDQPAAAPFRWDH